MTLVLKGTALNDEPISLPLIGRFDERGGTLGRSDTATFTLPDPGRTISRVQAQVLHRDDGYWIENVSAASPILHNGRALSAGMRVVLREGDELRVGGYTLQAAFENDATSATILRGRTVITQLETSPSPHGTPTPAEMPLALRGAPRNAPLPHPAGVQAPMSDESSWAAFLEGAGIASSPSNGASPERLRAIGAMMRIAVCGIHRLVAMRALAKGEMHTEMTRVQLRDNNPLKFVPDAEAALQLLLQPPARGFLDGPSALRAALTDLQSHQVAMMTAMRSALELVLDRFDPGKLDTQLTTESMFDALRPTHRKARLWTLYLERYASMREEAQEDFQGFFSDALIEAYEAEVSSLEAAADTAAPSAHGPRQDR